MQLQKSFAKAIGVTGIMLTCGGALSFLEAAANMAQQDTQPAHNEAPVKLAISLIGVGLMRWGQRLER